MRILHVIDSGGVYGAEVMLLRLMEEQERSGNQPILASIGKKGEETKSIEIEADIRGLQVQSFRMISGPNFFGAKQIIRYALSQNIDLLHSHGYKGNILLGLLPQRLNRLPMVTTVHGWTSTSGLTRMKIYECLDGFSLRFFDRVVVVSEKMLQHKKILNNKQLKLEVINNGITQIENNKQADCKAILKNYKGRIIIGAIGRLSKEKGFCYLLKAFKHVIDKGLNAQLYIIGEGNLRKELELQIEHLNIGSRVFMPGFIPKVSQYLSCFDFLVMPSLTEGMPITILEAMRERLPVIASAVGGIPEIIKNRISGSLIQPQDVDGLAHAILRLASDEELRYNLANNARKTFQKYYTSIKMADAYQTLYLNVLRQYNVRR